MLNMTVVLDKKDVFRYSIKMFIFIVIIYLFSKLINIDNIKENTLNLSNFINEIDLNLLIEDNLHIIKYKNNENIIDYEILDPLKIILNSQLSAIGSIKKKDDSFELISYEKINNNIEENKQIEQAQTGLNTKVIENNVPENFTNSFENVQIKNGTDYELTDEILTPNIEIKNKNVIIFHTHTCESYTASENYDYEETGTFRTTDLNYNVARVGDELDNQLTSYGFNVIHDKTYHDYPAYNGSYGRSQETIENILNEGFDTDIIIDIHRDAIGDYSYAPTVKIGEDYASQLMFVVGTDGGGLEHPNWQENLKFAIKIQEKANELYPGLFKPIILRNSRYNQQLRKGACIIEVGATGNTLEQSITSMKYLAKVLNEVIK